MGGFRMCLRRPAALAVGLAVAMGSMGGVAACGSGAVTPPSRGSGQLGTDQDGSSQDGSSQGGGTNPGATNPGGTSPGGTNKGGINPGGTNPGGTNKRGTSKRGTNPGGTNPGGTNPGRTGQREPSQGGGGQGGGGQSGGRTPTTAPPTATKSGPKYKWELPPGDISPKGQEGPDYGVLLSCVGAEEKIENSWISYMSPANLLFYMAAAHLCRGDEAGARPFYQAAMSQYGKSGLGTDFRACNVYRSVSSVLLQAPRLSFDCPLGPFPDWRVSGDRVDNPLTLDVDESQYEEGQSDPPPPESQPSDQETDPNGFG